MTPPELLAASLGACVGVYIVSYCKSAGIDPEGTAIEVRSEMVESPLRIGRLHATVKVPAGIPEDRRNAVLKVAEHCPIHQTLRNEPEVTIDLA